MDREQLLATAVAVGLVLGVDYQKNISNENLQKKIEEKNAEIEAQLKGNQDGDSTSDKQNENTLNVEIKDSYAPEDTGNQDIEIKDDYDDNILILRKTECGSYKTKIIGIEETARRSNLTVEQVKEALESGNPVGGYTFKFIG